MTTIADVTNMLDSIYPQVWAQPWDRVGLVCGRPQTRVDRVLFAVDAVRSTVEEALAVGAQLIVTHHPLLLRGVSSVATDTYKGELIHTLIESRIGLYVAHTNADTANPGVSDALAARLGLMNTRPLSPDPDDERRGIGRVGELPEPLSLHGFTRSVAAALPSTSVGIRAGGDPHKVVSRVAVCGGAGDSYLDLATTAQADVYVTADLRHHVAGEHLETSGPALMDVTHWASERPWLDVVSAQVLSQFSVDAVVSDINTDPWTIHVPASQ